MPARSRDDLLDAALNVLQGGGTASARLSAGMCAATGGAATCYGAWSWPLTRRSMSGTTAPPRRAQIIRFIIQDDIYLIDTCLHHMRFQVRVSLKFRRWFTTFVTSNSQVLASAAPCNLFFRLLRASPNGFQPRKKKV